MTDADFIISVFKKFFLTKELRKHFEIMGEGDIKKCEHWIQVELYNFFRTHCHKEFECHREYLAFVDQRKNNPHKKMFVDFAFRQKGFKKDKYILLELKYHSSPKTCISGMIKDYNKVNAVMRSIANARSFFALGIHLKNRMTKAEIKNYIINNEEDEEEITRDAIITNFIPRTDFAFTIVYKNFDK